MAHNPNHLEWRRIEVDGRPAVYAAAGQQGRPLVFLHGWGLGYRAYKKALRGLVSLGLKVYAPALPGFGGTADLPSDEFALPGYADWVATFMKAVEIDQPVTLVGHSFGGGVAIQTAHDHPSVVSKLVVVNSIGGSAWTGEGSTLKTIAERPLWDWGIHFPADVLPWRQVTRVLPVILEDAVPNLLRNPGAIWRVAGLARRADLTAELEELKRRRMPVVVLWGENDKVLPRGYMQSLQEALGRDCVTTVNGSHSWLLADPKAFAEVMTNVVEVAEEVGGEQAAEEVGGEQIA